MERSLRDKLNIEIQNQQTNKKYIYKQKKRIKLD